MTEGDQKCTRPYVAHQVMEVEHYMFLKGYGSHVIKNNVSEI